MHDIFTYIPNNSPSCIDSGSFLFNVSGRSNDIAPPKSTHDPKITNGKGIQISDCNNTIVMNIFKIIRKLKL